MPRANGNETPLVLSKGDEAIVYVEWKTNKQINKIFHLATFVEEDTSPHSNIEIQSFGTNCMFNEIVTLGLPLVRGRWATIYDPAWERGHRRVIYNVGGEIRIPGRYAIDFIKLNGRGRYAHGDKDKVSHWFGYGAPVIAVADGVVSSMRDDFEESITLSTHPRYPSDSATGNYVSIAIDDRRFVFYEHLLPGSIRVKVGQSLKKGDVIGAVGFTGQTTGPHLHFHIADKDSALGAEGLPFVFESFEAIGEYKALTRFGREKWKPLRKTYRNKERPGPNNVIRIK